MRIEPCKLDLVKESKTSVSELVDQSTAAGTPSAAQFDISGNLKLLPKFKVLYVCAAGIF